MLLWKVPPSLFVILIPPLASSHIKFRLLSFTPKHLSISCNAIRLGPRSSWSGALQGGAGSPRHYLQAELLLQLRFLKSLGNVWVLDTSKAVIKSLSCYLVPEFNKNQTAHDAANIQIQSSLAAVVPGCPFVTGPEVQC